MFRRLFHASQGPELGLPQMIQSRAQFGFRGVVRGAPIGTLFTFLGFQRRRLRTHCARAERDPRLEPGLGDWGDSIGRSGVARDLRIRLDASHLSLELRAVLCRSYTLLTVAIMLGYWIPATHAAYRRLVSTGLRFCRAVRRQRQLQHCPCAVGVGLLALSAA